MSEKITEIKDILYEAIDKLENCLEIIKYPEFLISIINRWLECSGRRISMKAENEEDKQFLISVINDSVRIIEKWRNNESQNNNEYPNWSI